MIEQPPSSKMLTWIKIRTGEPLTAIEIDKQNVYFGAISGYLGNYQFENNKTSYYQPICQQIIRGIYSSENKKIYIAVGDRYILIKDKNNIQQQKLNIQRVHTNTVCSYSLTMLRELKQIIFCAFPTQKRDPPSSELQIQKNRLYQVDIQNDRISMHRDFKLPDDSVPFDFDGERLLWMEYQQQNYKQFQYYDLTSKQIVAVKKFDSSFQFLSNARLVKNQCIFVENNKNVISYDMDKKTSNYLYSHSSSIVAFNIENRKSTKYTIISVDFNGNFKEWKEGKVLKNFNLWKLEKVPESIRQHGYLFDMGYSYYLRLQKDKLAVTTDLGLFVYLV